MKNRFKLAFDNLSYILLKADLHLVRLLIAAGSLIWGSLLLAQGTSPENLEFTSISTVYMFFLMSPIIWAWTFILHGIASTVGLLFNFRNPIIAILDDMLGALMWTMSSSLMLTSYYMVHQPPTPELSGHIVMAAFSWLILMRTHANGK